MLCCLVGALLAGNLVLACRLVASAARRQPRAMARRATLAGAAALVPLVAFATLAGHAGHESGGIPSSAMAAAVEAQSLCSGRMPSPDR